MPNQSALTSKKSDTKQRKPSKNCSAEAELSQGNRENRLRMISEAAYYRALKRGFIGGDPVEDWLMVEAEVDGMLYKSKEESESERLRIG